MEKLSTIMNDALGEYNEQHIPMNLVLFGDAMAQVCRICRVLRQPGGNSLLLGVGGSGRQSLARLATHIADMQLFQIEITKNYRVIEWREDLKNLLKLAGMEFKQVVFLFRHADRRRGLPRECGNILGGRCPTSSRRPYGPSSKRWPAVRRRGCRSIRQPLQQFIKMVKKHVHHVHVATRRGYHVRIRQFPSSSTTDDLWFSPWPRRRCSLARS